MAFPVFQIEKYIKTLIHPLQAASFANRLHGRCSSPNVSPVLPESRAPSEARGDDAPVFASRPSLCQPPKQRKALNNALFK